jgi:uncharacterized damage-inducible protein DinB
VEKELIAEFKRRVFGESYPRIFTCLDRLSEDQLWYKSNANSNSIGNLILHLQGNARQWMLSTFAAYPDNRERSKEFALESRVTKEKLINGLIELKNEIMQMLDSISEQQLVQDYQVQVFKEKGIAIIIHVIEHFSYHTGQIALLTKLMDDKDLEFYPYLLE